MEPAGRWCWVHRAGQWRSHQPVLLCWSAYWVSVCCAAAMVAAHSRDQVRDWTQRKFRASRFGLPRRSTLLRPRISWLLTSRQGRQARRHGVACSARQTEARPGSISRSRQPGRRSVLAMSSHSQSAPRDSCWLHPAIQPEMEAVESTALTGRVGLIRLTMIRLQAISMISRPFTSMSTTATSSGRVRDHWAHFARLTAACHGRGFKTFRRILRYSRAYRPSALSRPMLRAF